MATATPNQELALLHLDLSAELIRGIEAVQRAVKEIEDSRTLQLRMAGHLQQVTLALHSAQRTLGEAQLLHATVARRGAS